LPGALSADGEWLVFGEQGQGGGPEYSVYMRKTDGSPAVRLGSGSATGISRDGNWVASIHLKELDTIDLLPRGVGDTRTVRFPGLTIGWVAFLPGDKRLLLAANEEGHRVRFYVVDASGGAPAPITPEGAGFLSALSPDGTRLAVTGLDHGVTIVPIDGGASRAVPGTTGDDVPATWSKDGRALFAYVRAGEGVRVDRVEIDTGRRAPWKTIRPADPAGLLDVSFLLMTEDARSYVYSYRRFLSTLYDVDGLR
jgi:hypothetical protein